MTSVRKTWFVIGIILGVLLGFAAGAMWRVDAGTASGPLGGYGPCGDRYVVRGGDTTDDIIKRCMPGEHFGRAKDRLRPLNPHITSFGVIHPGDTIYLPERGR